MKTKRTASKIIDFLDGAVSTAVLAVFLLLFAFGVYVQWDSKQMLHQAEPVAYEAYKPTDAEHLTFSQLMERNPDVFGWLTLDGTKVDYPLVQGEDNDYYINTDVNGKFALSGSIFLDYRNRRDMTDAVSILHGHHMADDVMFGGFDKFADRDYFESHLTGSLFYDGADHALEIFAFLRADAYDGAIYNTGVRKTDKAGYIQLLLDSAEQTAPVDVNTERPILVMSTCESGETNGRLLLTAIIGEQLTAEEDEAVEAAPDRWPRRALWLAAALLTLAVILVGLHVKRRKIRREHVVSEPREDRAKQPSIFEDILSLVVKLLLIAAAFVALFMFIFGLHIYSGEAMNPAVKDRDLVVYYRLDKTADARELIVYEADGALRVGRIVAVPGDSVDVTSEGLRINGYLQSEDYARGETLAYREGVGYPIQLSSGAYFVLGDNREQSADSRVFGPVTEEQIRGRVFTVIRRRDF